MPTGDAILVFCLVFLSFGLMIAGYVIRKPQLVVAASIAWFLLGVYSYTHVVVLWDVFYCLFVFGTALSLISILEIVALVAGVAMGKKYYEEDSEEDEFRDEKEWQGERRMWRLGGGRASSSRRLPMPKPSSYSKTGIHEEKK